MAEPQEMNINQLKDFIHTEARNAGMEAMGDKVTEEVERSFKAWEKRSNSERRNKELDFQKMIRNERPEIKGLRDAFSHVEGAERMEFNGHKIAKLATLMAVCNYDPRQTTERAKKEGMTDVVKALEASGFADGGSLIPEEYSADFIGFLHNRSVVRSMGATVVQVPNGKLNFGRINATAVHYWVGEGQAITVSQPATGSLSLSPKKGGVLVPVGRDLLRRGGPDVQNIVANDMVEVTASGEDSAFIRGTGTEYTPRGIKNQIATGQNFNANATFNVANVSADAMKAMYKVDGNKIPMDRTGWLLNPRTIYALMGLRTTEGWPVFMEELARGMWFGHRVGKTDNIPKNLGGSNNATEIYFGSFSQFLIGETLGIEIESSTETSFEDADGNRVDAFPSDMEVMRLIHEVDCALRHDKAFSLIEDVKWGASYDS